MQSDVEPEHQRLRPAAARTGSFNNIAIDERRRVFLPLGGEELMTAVAQPLQVVEALPTHPFIGCVMGLRIRPSAAAFTETAGPFADGRLQRGPLPARVVSVPFGRVHGDPPRQRRTRQVTRTAPWCSRTPGARGGGGP